MERRDELDDRVQAAAEEMEEDLREMEHHSEEVGGDIDEARSDWEHKQDDPSVPGAEPEDEEQAGGEVAGDWEGEGPAADEGGQ
jgi:hypothetical protein